MAWTSEATITYIRVLSLDTVHPTVGHNIMNDTGFTTDWGEVKNYMIVYYNFVYNSASPDIFCRGINAKFSKWHP